MGIVAYLPATIVSLLLHALVIVFVFKGWGASAPPTMMERPAFIKATLVDLKTQGEKSAPKSTAKPKAVPKKVNLEKKRQDAAKKQAAKSQQLAKKEADAKSKQDKIKKQKLAKEKARVAEQAKMQARRDKQRKEAQAQTTRETLEKQRFQENLERERARLKAEQQAELAAVQLEADNIAALSYADAIRRRVEENWSRPASARNGMKVDLRIQLVPTGTIVNVVVLTSSGNAAFDRSAIRAVDRIGQFPEIKTMPSRIFEREFRQFTLLFQPQDLRQ
ncbi:MAG: colicin import membrane protein [Pseudohongiellaceae bacterium]|jgi:colicin import membrane protein